MGERWLECAVEDGMFSDENVVVFTTIDGQKVSFFVPKSAVKDGRVKVKALQEGDHFLIMLPNEDRSVVPVEEDILAVA